jgi:hypothetical protein
MHTYFYYTVCITPVMSVLCFWSVTGCSVIFCTVMSSVDAIISQINFLFIFWREFYVVEPYVCIVCRAVLTELFWGINVLIHNAMLSVKADPTPAAVRIYQTMRHHIPLHYSPCDCSLTFHLCQLPTPAGQTTNTSDMSTDPSFNSRP